MTFYNYLTLDVFTDQRFGGNPLAVLPNAEGLSTELMQAIAAEFNYSESTFVTASEKGLGPRVRIFTPKSELPFAGHPTVGTAFALRKLGMIQGNEAILEENAGPVPIRFKSDDVVTFKAPGNAEITPFGDVASAAIALSLPADAVISQPLKAGAGLAFPFIEVKDLGALKDARMSGADTVFAGETAVFCQTGSGTVSIRLFAPAHGIIEDPATGSAAAGLAVLLAARHENDNAELSWRVEQGHFMGRPSQIGIQAIKRLGKTVEIHVEGSAVSVAEGRIEV